MLHKLDEVEADVSLDSFQQALREFLANAPLSPEGGIAACTLMIANLFKEAEDPLKEIENVCRFFKWVKKRVSEGMQSE